ncbi:LytTR family DNA-binding domain-containing protein [Pedobacter frigoris]|uniref:LytR/AlgR family response regulator transcription factor n=1 Tax=Pedobacter frigoris TaxID=2571272 RepID=UPI00292F5B30|nr:LytTR family DNA-binding domain-containing protein [Pedobacter frigoris]
MEEKKYDILIIDDQLAPIKVFAKHIEQTENLRLIGYETNPIVAIQKLLTKELTADIILLDIQMPELSGFDVALEIGTIAHIIFITGYENYALPAFDYDADDFLMKNATLERFKKAIKKAVSRIELQRIAELQDQLIKVSLKVDGRLVLFEKADIEYFEGLDYFIKVALSSGRVKVCSNRMKELAKEYADKGFMRIHKSFLINLNKVASIDGNHALMKNGKKLPIGRLYRREFIEKIKR